MGFDYRASRACLVTGGAASGKTDFLLGEARRLVAQGVSARRILFVGAVPASVERARERLPEGVACMDARTLALEVLGALSDDGTGRRGRDGTDDGAGGGGASVRVLQAYEERFLEEDLRTTGLPQRQLGRITDYLWANMAALSDEGPDWLAMREEHLVHDALRARLAFTGGMVEPQVANRAARLLASGARLPDAWGFSHVLVDDYGLMSRSAQVLCNLLAGEGVAVAGEPGLSLAVCSRYPHAQGLDEFLAAYPSARRVELAGGRVFGEPVAGEACLRAETLRDEFDAVVAFVAEALAHSARGAGGAGGTGGADGAGGAGGPSRPPACVAVVGTNAVWRRNMAETLRAAGMAVSVPERPVTVGDFRDQKACRAARADALARWAANPDDGVALRSLLGFGDYCAQSARLKRLREQNPGRTLADLAASGCVERARELRAEALALRGTAGEAGASRVGAGCGVDGAFGADGTPSAPHAASAPGAVFVASPEQVFGRRFSAVVFGGCVQGWALPAAYFDSVGNRRKEVLDKALLSVECARRAAEGRLAFTWFASCSLEFAERYGLHYSRSRLVEGARTCDLVPFTPPFSV